MILSELRIKNFRSIRDATLNVENLTTLVGANGTGKSTVLHALRLFYAQPEKRGGVVSVSMQDFFNRDSSKAIEITCTYEELSDNERDRFGDRVQDDSLSVTRVLDAEGNSKLHGSRLMHGAFKLIRSASAAKDMKSAYDDLKNDNPKYSDLPKWTKKDDAEPALQEWEHTHPEDCSLNLDEGAFFGWGNVGKGKLDSSTKFIMVPAVRDASEDAEDSARSAIGTLLDMVVRKRLRAREDIKKLQEKINTEYQELLEPTREVLGALGEELTSSLSNLIPSATVTLDWNTPKDMSLPMPIADVQVSEDAFLCALSHVGHGLQRAFIITLLQHLTMQSESRESDEDSGSASVLPNLILAIEEPELYQHPNRQRHFARVLRRIATGEVTGVTKNTQVIYTTHSPLMVGLDRFDQIRLLRKQPTEQDKPNETVVESAKLQVVADKLKIATDSKVDFTSESLRARLAAIMTSTVNEGFFSQANVLVEGEGDRAVILGAATLSEKDLEGNGISVVPAGSKNNLDRLYLIFTSFGIPCYLVWDNDHGMKSSEEQKQVKANRLLLHLLDEPQEDWPVKTCNTYCCFDKNLEKLLKSSIPSYHDIMSELKEEYGYDKDRDALKSPFLMSELLKRGKQQGYEVAEIHQIVDFAQSMIGNG
ncbi:MAG TPA: ATP-dependent endonuclease [Bacteroidetes bacterium]|nr:recombination protein F [bacterium BMS3Bbin04]HDO64891.1 ATP-dependent endonuclease [Bacteroidota bacterium]HEX04016.1 ATP-dependent endonuclease [Bacteroidota bacterium]